MSPSRKTASDLHLFVLAEHRRQGTLNNVTYIGLIPYPMPGKQAKSYTEFFEQLLLGVFITLNGSSVQCLQVQYALRP